jgi:DNA-directed RNA polymerase specialized sigma24 family protein
MNTDKKIQTTQFIAPKADNDTQSQDAEFDELVTLAAGGDRRAVGAIAIALGPSLLKEARTVLKGLENEAEDVLQDFLLFLLERRAPFNRANGHAMEWMHRMVRTIAHQRRRERGG